MENIRGREKVEAGQLCERKNGRGVDPNRNWAVHWGFKEKGTQEGGFGQRGRTQGGSLGRRAGVLPPRLRWADCDPSEARSPAPQPSLPNLLFPASLPCPRRRAAGLGCIQRRGCLSNPLICFSNPFIRPFCKADYDPSEEYPGTAAFSEPEAALMLRTARTLRPHVWASVHSGMEALFMPYDHKASVPGACRGEGAAHAGPAEACHRLWE